MKKGVLFTPLVLAFASPTVLGALVSFGGVGMLVGSVAMGIWGGPKRRVLGMLGFALGCGISILLVGIRVSVPLIGGAVFAYFVCFPISVGCTHTQVILQSKVALDVQGRVLALNGMLTSAAVPLASVLAGPLSDRVFEPLLAEGGALASSVGQIIGVGPGRGIGLLFVAAGFLTVGASLAGYLYPRLRHVESELPDAIDSVPVAAKPTLGTVHLREEWENAQ